MLHVLPLTSSIDVVISIIAYSLCSGSLVLINKLILHSLPFPSLVIALQLVAAIGIIYGLHFCGGWIDIDPIKWKFVWPYLAYTFAFSVGVYCNMKSLSLSNVETVIVFRALAPLLVSVLDAAFLGRAWPSLRSWVALATIAAGAYGYAATDEKFQTQGYAAYFWPTAYLFTISFEMAYGKKIIQDVDLKTRSGPVQYTNILGFPPMILFAQMGGEFNKLRVQWLDDGVIMLLRWPVGMLLVMGCVVGTGIGYSGWWCRSKVSATSYTLIGIMNKCLTIIVNYFIWDQHAAPIGILSLGLCLIGGAIYRQAPMKDHDSSTKSQRSQKAAALVDAEENMPVEEGMENDDAEQRVPLVLEANSEP